MPVSHPLDYRDVNPVIRIAHRLAGQLRIPRRQIFDHELVLMTVGRTEFVEDNQRRICVAGDLLIIRPFCWHLFNAPDDRACEHTAVHFDFALGIPPASPSEGEPVSYEVQLSDGLCLPDFVASRTVKAEGIDADLNALVRAWEDRRPPNALAARAHLLKVLIALLNISKEPTAASDAIGSSRNWHRIKRVIDFIDGHLDRAIEADQLAATAGVSPSQLARLFRQHTGHAPMQYLRRARVDRARRLLGDVDLSIKEIARLCGFEDQYHFSRVFHEIDGLPPTLYRQALLAGRTNPRTD